MFTDEEAHCLYLMELRDQHEAFWRGGTPKKPDLDTIEAQPAPGPERFYNSRRRNCEKGKSQKG